MLFIKGDHFRSRFWKEATVDIIIIMYLNQKDCQHYYCAQAKGGGGAYFQGIRYQRGGGFFQNIFRSISPLMIKAGKYFGKKLLRAGGNVLTDVASGSLLKDSARTRFQEESENIKDDLLQKIQQQRGEGIKKKRRKKSTQSTSARRGTNSRRKSARKTIPFRNVHRSYAKLLFVNIETYLLKKK